MIIILSPSKTISPRVAASPVAPSTPLFIDDAVKLVVRVNRLGRNLGKTLGVSPKLANENRQRFLDWQSDPSPDRAIAAAWAYRGETYGGLQIEELDEVSLEYAQEHLYIVSGLYGLLRPHDQIMPYRLEMSTRLKIGTKNNLYQFWGDKLAKKITIHKPDFVLNCASDEYSKAVRPHLLTDIPVVTPKFLHDGRSKMVFAKFMRGTMARWAISNRVSTVNELKTFGLEGYVYDEALSSIHEPVFIAPKNFTIKGRWSTK